jgi:carboxyvinyl-carboxyphosphonate phosphorylmutase
MKKPSARQTFRSLMSGPGTSILPVVHDAISALVTRNVGFEIALISGNVSAAATFGYPDIGLVSMTEMAQLVRQINRAAPLGYLVDAENGFGNALNVQRTVSEFEAAGASAIMIEDTEMPQRFGAAGKTFISCEEACAKLRAALEARNDPDLVIVGRCDALHSLGMQETIRRVQAYSECGVDAIFVPAAKSRADFRALRQATKLPLIAVGLPADRSASGLAFLAECSVSLTVTSTIPFQVAVQASFEALTHLRATGEFGPFTDRACSRAYLDELLGAKNYEEKQSHYNSPEP